MTCLGKTHAVTLNYFSSLVHVPQSRSLTSHTLRAGRYSLGCSRAPLIRSDLSLGPSGQWLLCVLQVFVTMPTGAELKGPGFLRHFLEEDRPDSVTAPAGVRGRPGRSHDVTRRSTRRACGGGGGIRRSAQEDICITAPGLSVCCPLVCVDGSPRGCCVLLRNLR